MSTHNAKQHYIENTFYCITAPRFLHLYRNIVALHSSVLRSCICRSLQRNKNNIIKETKENRAIKTNVKVWRSKEDVTCVCIEFIELVQRQAFVMRKLSPDEMSSEPDSRVYPQTIRFKLASLSL